VSAAIHPRTLPSLNGWRAVSILLVLLFHTGMVAGFPTAYAHLVFTVFDGNLGVRFFFVISGFLITWLMLKEEAQNQSLSLKNFYVRRTLRIWPVYLACLLVLAAFQFTGAFPQHPSAWRGLLTFTRNFYNPWAGSGNDVFSAHCWSLSVEEQFYVAWPVMFCLLRGKGRAGFLLATIALSWGFKMIDATGAYDRHWKVWFQPYSTFAYMDCLAWGCLAAIVFLRRRDQLEAIFLRSGTALSVGALILIIAPAAVDFGKSIQPVAFTVLLLHSVLCPGWTPFRILNLRWMDRLGVLSYSIYIWQQLVQLLWPHSLGVVWFLWLPATVGIAWLSYRFLERPFVRLRSKFRDPHTKLSALVDRENLKPASPADLAKT